MAVAVQQYGAGLVKWNGSELGYCRNQPDLVDEGFFGNVPVDYMGGDEGPPCDVQFFGAIMRIRLELTKWDSTVAALVRARLAAAALGTPATSGTLMFAGAKTGILVILTTTWLFTFNRTFPRGAIELGVGTRFSTLVCEFEAHADADGKVYTQVATGS